MTEEKPASVGGLIAAVGKLIIYAGAFGVLVFVAYALLHG